MFFPASRKSKGVRLVVLGCLDHGTTWQYQTGYTSTLTIDSLIPNKQYNIDVYATYMNQDVLDSSATIQTISARTQPEPGSINISIEPRLQLDKLVYDLTFMIDTTNNDQPDTLTFAIFREEHATELSNYLLDPINTGRVDTAFHTGIAADFFVSSTIVLFPSMTEADIEQFPWIVLIENAGTGDRVRIGNVFHLSATSIAGTDGKVSPGAGTRNVIEVNKEASNRFAKTVTINKLNTGLALFAPTDVKRETYKVNSRPVESIALEVTDYVPELLSGNREDYIRYYLVLGDQRFPLSPRNKTDGNFPQLYHINLTIEAQLKRFRRELLEEFIEIDQNTDTFSIECEVTGEPTYRHLTPIVYNWRVLATSGSTFIKSAGTGVNTRA
jgi:hypothetical protein